MWHIENPSRVYSELVSNTTNRQFYLLMREEKYQKLPAEDRSWLENIDLAGYDNQRIKIRDPDNPANLICARFIKYEDLILRRSSRAREVSIRVFIMLDLRLFGRMNLTKRLPLPCDIIFRKQLLTIVILMYPLRTYLMISSESSVVRRVRVGVWPESAKAWVIRAGRFF